MGVDKAVVARDDVNGRELPKELDRVERAFMSKQEEKVNFWLRFGFFYLCNGRHITELLPAQPSGARRRTPGRIEVRLCAGRYKDKK